MTSMGHASPRHSSDVILEEMPDYRILAPSPSDVGKRAEALARQEATAASRLTAFFSQLVGQSALIC